MATTTILTITLLISLSLLLLGFFRQNNYENIFYRMSGSLIILITGLYLLVNGGITIIDGYTENTIYSYSIQNNYTNLDNTSTSVANVYSTNSSGLSTMISWVLLLGGMAGAYYSWIAFITYRRGEDEGGVYSE